jgi:UDP-N-acetylglucosamine transferase subunit ALG13
MDNHQKELAVELEEYLVTTDINSLIHEISIIHNDKKLFPKGDATAFVKTLYKLLNI